MKYFQFINANNLFYYIFTYYFLIQSFYSYYGKEYSLSLLLYQFLVYPIILLWIIYIFKDFFRREKRTFPKSSLIILFLIAYMLSYLILYTFYNVSYIGPAAIYFQIKVLVFIVLNILIGVYVAININNHIFKNMISIIWFIYTLLIIFNINYVTLTLDNNNVPALHLLFGDTYALVTFLTIITLKKWQLKLFLMTIGIFIVYTIQSRASFYSFLVVYVFFIIKTIGMKNSIYLFMLVLFSTYTLVYLDLIEIEKRMFGALFGESDGSLSHRLLQFYSGFDSINKNLFFGDYLGQLRERAGIGEYMHNIFSFLRQYGILFFVTFCILYFYLLIQLFIKWLRIENSTLDSIFYITLFLAILLLLFRSYVTPYFWFSLGIGYHYLYYNLQVSKN